MEKKSYSKKIFYILLFFAAILGGFICKSLRTVMIPVILSVMLAFLLLPFIKFLNKKLKCPWVLASVIVIILFVIAFFGISSLLISSFTSIVNEYPKYESKFMDIYEIIALNLDLEFDKSQSFIGNIFKNFQVRETVQKAALFLSTGIFSFGKNFFLVILLCVFLLLEMGLTKEKMSQAFTPDKEKFSRVSGQIVNDTMRYISIKFFISLATGILAYIGTKSIGMDFPIIWGFVSFIMNFIPVFGSILAVGVTTLFSIMQFYPTWGIPIFVLFYMTGINMLLGNILEPRIEGKNLGISPFVIIVSLSLWGYIWGFIGMILAVPVTVIIKIFCENIEELNRVAIILSNGPSLTSNPQKAKEKKSLFKRLFRNKTKENIINNETVQNKLDEVKDNQS